MLKQACAIGDSCGCGFRNTGANFSHVWKKLETIIKNEVWCEECKIHGLEEISALRDHIKIGIGGKPFNPSNYEKWVKEINCVNQKYQYRKKEFGGFQ